MIDIIEIRPLANIGIIGYLNACYIPLKITEHFCKEVHYEFQGHVFCALGFRNDSGGWSLQQGKVRRLVGEKGITLIKNGSKRVAVFKDFQNFLSFLVINPYAEDSDWDFYVLNDWSELTHMKEHLYVYTTIHLFFDNDPLGKGYTKNVMSTFKNAIDSSYYIC